ncbi:LPXTG cell wall anchor domain-containing protein [Enterococcus faecalis]|uniref:LPXTG cell wall anchor domain-containing protein n=1 Tax=Enterococcus faecalis TaxID=1351 RepID=UPI002DB705F6|nr:LPXTG cell wall anchor domain-containing protein [Enterococcus faecalis]MEB7954563.1 LPXTG cell wall anchor domain-containing protein [Enterococcus faecalis]MEB7964726.1 LPXTG cell wall anchor domain-containing protein [Enterococcus faecalis]
MRKKRIKACLAMAVVITGLASASFGVSASAKSADQANTEVAVTLTRKVTPSELPGSNGGASNTSTSSQTKGAVGTLPYTGVNQNYLWVIVGCLLVTIFLMIKYFDRKIRKED